MATGSGSHARPRSCRISARSGPVISETSSRIVAKRLSCALVGDESGCRAHTRLVGSGIRDLDRGRDPRGHPAQGQRGDSRCLRGGGDRRAHRHPRPIRCPVEGDHAQARRRSRRPRRRGTRWRPSAARRAGSSPPRSTHRAAHARRRRRRRAGRRRRRRRVRRRSHPSAPARRGRRGHEGQRITVVDPHVAECRDDLRVSRYRSPASTPRLARRRYRASCDSVGVDRRVGIAPSGVGAGDGCRIGRGDEVGGIHVRLERQRAQRARQPGLQLSRDIRVAELQCETRVRRAPRAVRAIPSRSPAPQCRARGSPRGSRGRRRGSRPCPRRRRADPSVSPRGGELGELGRREQSLRGGTRGDRNDHADARPRLAASGGTIIALVDSTGPSADS